MASPPLRRTYARRTALWPESETGWTSTVVGSQGEDSPFSQSSQTDFTKRDALDEAIDPTPTPTLTRVPTQPLVVDTDPFSFDSDEEQKEKKFLPFTSKTNSTAKLGRTKSSSATTTATSVASSAPSASSGKRKRLTSSGGSTGSKKPSPPKRPKLSPERPSESPSKGSFVVREAGERSALQEEVEYLLDGLAGSQPQLVRCHSAYSLAALFRSDPELGLLFRAHADLFARVYAVLDERPRPRHDSPLALCLVAMLYYLFRDPLNADFATKPAIGWLLQFVLDTGPSPNGTPAKPLRCSPRAKVRTKGPANVDRDDNIVAKTQRLLWGDLAVDIGDDPAAVSAHAVALQALANCSLLRAGPLHRHHSNATAAAASAANFREAVCEVGGLDKLAALFVSSVECLEQCVRPPVDTDGDTAAPARPRLAAVAAEIDAQLRILDSVTHGRAAVDMQTLLIGWGDAQHGMLVRALLRLVDVAMETAGMPALAAGALRVLINLSNDNQSASRVIGGDTDALSIALRLLKHEPFPFAEHAFDMRLLSLGLLTNLVEHSPENRDRMARLTVSTGGDTPEAAIDLIVRQFVLRRNAASGAGPEDDITAAYAALLLGCVIREHAANREAVLAALPGGSVVPLLEVLREFVRFQTHAGLLAKDALESVKAVMEDLAAADPAATITLHSDGLAVAMETADQQST